MNKLFILISLSLIVTGCPKNDDFVQPKPTPVVTDTEWCKAAEDHLKYLQCIPDDKPYTKKGKSFTQFCLETQTNGIFINPKCLAEIKDCSEIDYCTGTKDK